MIKEVNFTFVILHYSLIAETKKCIDSIQKYCNSESYEIVIVDNNSPNGTGNTLAREYEETPHVTVLLNKRNDGFARGNNVGIRFARENFKQNFIIVLNNDIEMIDSQFCHKVQREYDRSHFALLGPKILLPSGVIGDYSPNPATIKSVVTEMVKNTLKLSFLYIGLYRLLWEKRVAKKSETSIQQSDKLVRQEGVILHGSCLVFSERFFSKLKGFNPRTFMYKEEQLLHIDLKRYDLLPVYNPDLTVLHNEGASTKDTTGSNKNKLIFLYKNQLRSSFILLAEMIK